VTAWLWRLGAMAAVIAAVFAAGYVKGKSDGRVAALKDTVAAYQKRGDVDATVRNMDAVDLCVELGGLPDECAGLRGLASDTSEARDGGVSGRQ
jgi:hypothetical protein